MGLFISTLCFQFFKALPILKRTCILISCPLHLLQSFRWRTVSKAFWSLKTLQKFFLTLPSIGVKYCLRIFFPPQIYSIINTALGSWLEQCCLLPIKWRRENGERNVKRSPAEITKKGSVRVFPCQVLLRRCSPIPAMFSAFILFCTIQPYLVPLTTLLVHITQLDSAWGKILINYA